MLLKDRFKLLREKLKFTQKNMADVLGCGVGKIKQIEIGKTESISFADANLLEKKFKISEQWLRFDKGDMFIEKPIIDEATETKMHSLLFISDINSIRMNNLENSYIKLPASLLESLDNTLISLSFYEDSMTPTFNIDDLIVIDKQKKEIVSNKIYVVLHDNEIYTRRIFKLPKERIMLKADNVYYPDIEVSSNELEVLGQVVQTINFKKLF